MFRRWRREEGYDVTIPGTRAYGAMPYHWVSGAQLSG